MSENGKGSARRGTSKEEMKRFADNYDDIFRKPQEVLPEKLEEPGELCICIDCLEKADWVRCTQFAGDHPFCDKHAKSEKDFGKNDGYAIWQTIKEYLGSRRRK